MLPRPKATGVFVTRRAAQRHADRRGGVVVCYGPRTWVVEHPEPQATATAPVVATQRPPSRARPRTTARSAAGQRPFLPDNA